MAYETSTYRRLSQIILNEHYNGVANPDAPLTLRHIAEIIATKVAKYAKVSAFENSNMGEATFANDQFISVFKNISLLTDDVTDEKYITLPATPAGLPRNQEIVHVAFQGCPQCHVVPCLNKDSFFESLLPKVPFSMYIVQDGKLVFKNLPKLVTNSNAPVMVKMVGAVPGDTLLDSQLNIPKDVESSIRMEVLGELAQLYKVKPQTNVNTDAA